MRNAHFSALALLSLLLCSVGTHPAWSQGVIAGEVQVSKDESHLLRVEVYAQSGLVSAVAPVLPDGAFQLTGLSDGIYSAVVVGSMRSEYHAMHVLVAKGKLALVEDRWNPLRKPQLEDDASHGSAARKQATLRFLVKAHIDFSERQKPWPFLDILQNKFLMFQVVGVIFVLLFPKYLKSLDKESLEELTGEKEPDLGDPNEVVKALIGYDKNSEFEILPALNKRRTSQSDVSSKSK